MVLTTFISMFIIIFYLYCLVIITRNLSTSIYYKRTENIIKNTLIVFIIFSFYLVTIALTLQNNTIAILVILFIILIAITITIITHFQR